MAVYEDLLAAIARVRAGTGDADGWMRGLSGADLAVAANLVAVRTPGAIDTVLAKIRGGHPELFDPPPAAPATPGGEPQPGPEQGSAAEAIRTAETALAHQNSTTAQVDLQVITAVLNAHASDVGARAVLDGLQRDVEAAVAGRTDLDTPAGARGFQRYLIDKLRDIRTVVETAGLDATSKAALVAALTRARLVAAEPVGGWPGAPLGQRNLTRHARRDEGWRLARSRVVERAGDDHLERILGDAAESESLLGVLAEGVWTRERQRGVLGDGFAGRLVHGGRARDEDAAARARTAQRLEQVMRADIANAEGFRTEAEQARRLGFELRMLPRGGEVADPVIEDRLDQRDHQVALVPAVAVEGAPGHAGGQQDLLDADGGHAPLGHQLARHCEDPVPDLAAPVQDGGDGHQAGGAEAASSDDDDVIDAEFDRS